jgi:hypothetical protein
LEIQREEFLASSEQLISHEQVSLYKTDYPMYMNSVPQIALTFFAKQCRISSYIVTDCSVVMGMCCLVLKALNLNANFDFI